MFSRSFKFALLVSASLGVAACGVFDPWSGGQRIDSSEDLLAAEGTWHLVEEKRIPAPAQHHEMARQQVNPDDMRNETYTTTQAPQMAASGQDIHYRLLRMEREVQSLRRDFNKLLPPLKQLLISDAQLKNTIDGVEAVGGYASSSGQAAAPSIKTPTAKQTAKAASYSPQPRASGPGVQRVRLGQHPGKTRIVLDVSGPASYNYDVDNNERLLLIDLPSTPWSTASTRSFSKHPLIARYSASDNGSGGTMLAIQLKRPVKVLDSAALKPNHVHGNRIMFDIGAL